MRGWLACGEGSARVRGVGCDVIEWKESSSSSPPPSRGRLAYRCPDCVVAEPAIHAAFAEAGVDGTLVTAWVKRSEYRGNPAYPYRTHKDIKLPAIPTLKFWSKKVKASLVEAQCTDCDLLRDIVELK